jgi:broad specificity phosphatase PhoE
MIYLIRHGQTLWNIQERKQGHQDSPLTEEGIYQASAIGTLLKKNESDLSQFRILSSPLGRARHTAEIILNILNNSLSLQFSPYLKETCFGNWEGKSSSELLIQFPKEMQERKKDRWNYRIPGGGESYQDVYERVVKFFETYDRTSNLIIITHGLTSRLIQGFLLSLGKEEIMDLNHIQNTFYSITDSYFKSVEISPRLD